MSRSEVHATTDAVVIIGAGAAAVSAAWPLVEAGREVLMLAPQPAGSTTPREGESFSARRRQDPGQWKDFLGEDFVGIGRNAAETPKMKVPGLRFIQDGFTARVGLTAHNITPTGSLVAGGLTQMWGAGAFCYTDEDLAGTALQASDLSASYERVAARIGVSGVEDDAIAPYLGLGLPLQAPIPLHPNFEHVLSRAAKRPPKAPGFALGRTRNAVLTEDRTDRLACNLSNLCLWGCPRQSIYSAAHDLDALKRRSNFTLRDDVYVESLEAMAGEGNAPLYRIRSLELRTESSHPDIVAGTIMLAAGTLASTRLALQLTGRRGVPQPLFTHPAYAMVGLNLSRVGARSAESGFALGHLAYRVQLSEDDSVAAFGVMFPSEGLLMSDLAANMPFSMRGSVALTRALAPALVVMNGYVRGEHGWCTLKLGEDGRTELAGGYRESFEPTYRAVTSRLRKEMRRLGVWPLPGGTRRAELGSDSHYAGGLAMTADPDPRRLTTTPEGELRDAPGVFAVDGAALPRLGLKHPTFTIMANADRISSALQNSGRI